MTSKSTAAKPPIENEQRSSRETIISQVTDFIAQNKIWMLTTCGSDRVMRSRPMLNINDTFKGDLHLFAYEDDAFMPTIAGNPQINIVISEPHNGRYASITGKASTISDGKKSEILWNQRCADWFESEKPPGNVSLVKVDVEDVEYWESTEPLMKKLGRFFQMTGSGLTETDVEHQKLSWKKQTDAAG